MGTPGQIATRIVEGKKRGVNLLLTCCLHFQEETAAFGRDVMPIVRALETGLARKHGTELDTSLLPATNFDKAGA